MTTRTRSRGGFSAQTPLTSSAWPQGCSAGLTPAWYNTPAYDWTPLRVGFYETMQDIVVPGFAKRRAAGELFFNPMYYSRFEAIAQGSGYHIQHNVVDCAILGTKNEYKAIGNCSAAFIPTSTRGSYGNVPTLQTITDPGTVRDLMSEVSTELLAKRGHSDSNLFESIAEANQTIGLFERPLARLTQTFNKAAEAKRLGRLTGYTVDGVSHLWLAYRYGISPALRDIEGIIDGLQKKTEKRRETTRAKGGFEDTRTLSLSLPRPPGWSASVTCDVTESYTVRAFSLDEYSTSLWENIGFSSKGLLTLPWELLRFSFVYDWFLNVGSFINAQVPAFGWKQLGSGLVTIHGVTNRYKVQNAISTSSGYSTLQNPNGTCEVNFLEKTRGPLSFPDIVIRNDFRFDRFKRVADAFALLAQQGKGLFGPGPRRLL